LQDFQVTFKNIIGVYLKHSSFWPAADVKPMPNDLVHVMCFQCMYALSTIKDRLGIMVLDWNITMWRQVLKASVAFSYHRKERWEGSKAVWQVSRQPGWQADR
jgi:hypothetical protein